MKSRNYPRFGNGCAGCAHWRLLGSSGGENKARAFHYILDTGKRRGCPVDGCTKKAALHTGGKLEVIGA